MYVNEHLTMHNKNLLYQAKKLKQLGFKYVWTVEGKIFIRKSENDERIRVTTITELNKLAGQDIEAFGKGTQK